MSGMGHQRPYAVSSAIGCRAPKPVIPTSVNGRRGSTIAAVGDRPVAQLLHLRDINRFPPAIGVVRRSGSQCGSSRCRSSARQIADIISTNRALTIPGKNQRRQRKSDQIESCRSAGDRNELEGNWRQPFEHDDPCVPLGEARFERLVLGRASRLDGRPCHRRRGSRPSLRAAPSDADTPHSHFAATSRPYLARPQPTRLAPGRKPPRNPEDGEGCTRCR